MLAFLVNGQLDSLLVGIAAAVTLRFLKNAITQSKTEPAEKPTIIMDTKELEKMEKRALGEPYQLDENRAEDLLQDLEKQEA